MYLVPFVFAFHIGWIILTINVAKSKDHGGVALPTNFRSVVYLDVFGWLTPPGQLDTLRSVNVVGAGTDPDRTASERLAARPVAAGPAARPVAPSDAEAIIPAEVADGAVPQVYQRLVQDTMALQHQLQEDLLRWETTEVSRLLRNDETTQQELQQLRRRFDDAQADLFAQVPHLSAQSEVRRGATREEVWLRLLWPEADPPRTYFYREGHTVWDELQRPGARIIDLTSLSEQMAALHQKVRAVDGSRISDNPDLVRAANLAQASFRAGPQPCEVPATSRRRRHLPGHLPRDTVRNASVVLVVMWFIGFVWSLCDEFKVTPHLKPTVNPKARGAELFVTSGVLPPLEEAFSGAWPHAFFRPVGLAARSSSRAGPSSPPTLLVAERYAVHELQLDASGRVVGSPQKVYTKCLADAPSFHGRGIADVSVACSRGALAEDDVAGARDARAACELVLLGVGGREALRCHDDHAARTGVDRRFSLQGGPWHALSGLGAAARLLTAPSGQRHFEELWALKAGEALALLRSSDPPLGRGTLPLAPALDIADAAARGLSILHVFVNVSAGSDRTWMLALGRRPFRATNVGWHLSAIPLSGERASYWQSWTVPTPNGADAVDWTGICVVKDSIYLSGLLRIPGSRDGSDNRTVAGIWRTDVPAELRRTVTARPQWRD